MASNSAMQRANQPKLDRIAIMSVNFDRILKIEGQQDPARTLDIMHLPQLIADRYHGESREPRSRGPAERDR